MGIRLLHRRAALIAAVAAMPPAARSAVARDASAAQLRTPCRSPRGPALAARLGRDLRAALSARPVPALVLPEHDAEAALSCDAVSRRREEDAAADGTRTLVTDVREAASRGRAHGRRLLARARVGRRRETGRRGAGRRGGGRRDSGRRGGRSARRHGRLRARFTAHLAGHRTVHARPSAGAATARAGRGGRPGAGYGWWVHTVDVGPLTGAHRTYRVVVLPPDALARNVPGRDRGPRSAHGSRPPAAPSSHRPPAGGPVLPYGPAAPYRIRALGRIARVVRRGITALGGISAATRDGWAPCPAPHGPRPYGPPHGRGEPGPGATA
ncbi:hypothetical protein ACFY93_18980 [Streptomyces sp. NPDC008313]|uniref:hypothetical protein n=1 Tax=Streptomyces sp. NPDC008313 TaxID=3364826 RepID=UPI0036E8A8A8